MRIVFVIFMIVSVLNSESFGRSDSDCKIEKSMCTVVDVISCGKNVEYEKKNSDGVGFIIDEKGYIITNCHVIDSAEKIKIVLHDKSEYFAKVVGKDERSDIALLRIDVDVKLPVVQFADSDKVNICEKVFAIGNPFGFGKTVTSGIISYKGRDLSQQIAELGVGGDLVSYLQTDASVTYGNSGGPLCLSNGDVVGMITVFFSESGHSTGINFAIPSNTLKKVINQLKNFGKMRRSWLGIQVSTFDKGVAQALGLCGRHGCFITKIEPNSPAFSAGLQAGDILLMINNEQILADSNVEYMLNNISIDNKVIPIQILRKGVEMMHSITVGVREDGDFVDYKTDESLKKKDLRCEKVDGLDFCVTDLTKDIRKTFEIPDDVNGVMVSSVGESCADKIASSYVIMMINQVPISNVISMKAELAKVSSVLKHRGSVALYIFDPQIKSSKVLSVAFKFLQIKNDIKQAGGVTLTDRIKNRFFNNPMKSNAN